MTLSKFDPLKANLIVGETMIEANAGTGKTFTLCRIVERLVLEKRIPIERILAVTFTNAAAFELKEKIREGLYNKRISLPDKDITGKILLSKAIANFDNARIFTLHAFCKRLLSEFSFECGVRPESDLIINENRLLEQVARDFRRSYFLKASPFCCSLSYTGKLTTQNLIQVLKEKDKQDSNEKKEDEEEEPINEDDFNEIIRKTHLDYTELVKLWSEQYSEIKDFLFSEDKKAKNGSPPRNEFYNFKQRFSKALENLIDYFPDFELLNLIRKNLKKEVTANDGFEAPSFFERAAKFCEQCQRIENFILSQFLLEGKSQLTKLKDIQNVRTFDDLQELVADGLKGERGSSLIQKVYAQFDAALVDEFQDTDPLQFNILKKLFTQKEQDPKKYIFYIGDPKQSIYKFRGADLNNYLNIRADLKEENICSLTTNYRTHENLVEAVNCFLTNKISADDKTNDNLFMDKRIVFEKSLGNEEKSKTKIFSRAEKDLPTSPFNIRYSIKLSKKETKNQIHNGILNDMAREILSLLDKEKTTTIGGRAINGSDIAVLCNTNKQADAIYRILNKVEVPCVLQATRSIYSSPEADHFKFLMEALLSPNDTGKIKKVLVLPIFGLTAKDIERINENENEWDFWANRFSSWAKLWCTQGFSYTLQTIFKDNFYNPDEKDEENSPYQPIKKRILRNDNGERCLTNYLHLGELLFQAEQTVSANFPRNLYLWYINEMKSNMDIDESDARLESDEKAVKIITIHKSKGLEFPITFIPFCWKTKRSSSKKEVQQENMRLLYVALTRASSRLYLYVREPDKNFIKSNISRCLSLDLDGEFEKLKQNKRLFSVENCKFAELESKFVRNLNVSKYVPLNFSSEIPSGKINSSFSQKVKGQNKDKDLDESEEISEKKIVPSSERKFAHSFPAGTQAGNFFHDTFENIDFSKNEHRDVIEAQLKKHGIKKADSILAQEIILATLRVELNKHKGESFRLSQLKPENMIPEMEFHINSPDFSFSELGQHLAKTNSSCIFTSYLTNKNDSNPLQFNQQFFKGFIDLTFKINNQYFIIDWKSNLLTGEQKAFEATALPKAMLDADYLLQYHLYILALHRYLKTTLQGQYNYMENLGGAYYLFLRGIHKPDNQDDGIFFDCPEESVIEAMDEFLSPESTS